MYRKLSSEYARCGSFAMTARPVADFKGAITQLLLPSKFSVGCSSPAVSTAKQTL
jgi:hypothetical protein